MSVRIARSVTERLRKAEVRRQKAVGSRQKASHAISLNLSICEPPRFSDTVVLSPLRCLPHSCLLPRATPWAVIYRRFAAGVRIDRSTLSRIAIRRAIFSIRGGGFFRKGFWGGILRSGFLLAVCDGPGGRLRSRRVACR